VWLHGSLGREAATGRGTVFAIRELFRAQGMGEISGKTFVIQVRAGQGCLSGCCTLAWQQCGPAGTSM
jgi:glutamate dehydrogenase (NAD(P)+)